MEKTTYHCPKGRFVRIPNGIPLAIFAQRMGCTLYTLLMHNPYLDPTHYIVGQVVIVPRRSFG